MRHHEMTERFREFVEHIDGEHTIDELARSFLRTEGVTTDYRAAALEHVVKTDLRRYLNSFRTADGLPRLFSGSNHVS